MTYLSHIQIICMVGLTRIFGMKVLLIRIKSLGKQIIIPDTKED